MVRVGFRKTLVLSAFVLIALGLAVKTASNRPSILPSDEAGTNPGNGEVQGANLGLPKELPADLPVYPNTTVVSSSSSVGLSQVSLLVEENVDRVKDFYSINLLENGWKSAGQNHYTRDAEVLELDFTPRLEKQSLVILTYSPIPTK